MLVGDYTNPILKPAAAEIVKKRGEISQSGLAFPDPDYHVHVRTGAVHLLEL